MYILWPLLIGLIIGITVYGIINASNNNPKVIKVLTLIGLIIAIIYKSCSDESLYPYDQSYNLSCGAIQGGIIEISNNAERYAAYFNNQEFPIEVLNEIVNS
ncbi:hypothetical protein [Anaerocolumna chitinilytica]|uniref:Uncharacterized protein n=1 Tax=Anaerocolumna chitinilytica TaxID=1727145 RepID=A0A7I8DHD0_9FIRM|nr:hypothetical protein [Anaerocolumna chitinilytica]BCJ97742.1 hypothetical protein bsdcttw_07830 [Anaerocolumna chitinilytica]